MSKREELQQKLYNQTQSYSLSVEGTPALLRSEIITHDDLTTGDKVTLFVLPEGKTFISKVKITGPHTYTVGRVTLSHIYFDDEMSLEEV